MTEQKVSLSFYSSVTFLCVLKHLTMGTPFPCVPAAFQQRERRSHAFPLEMTPARNGCCIGGLAVNIISYADDIILLAPS